MSVYAISDLHGCYNIYEQVNNIIKPDDTVICLGDCGDRGPHSWKTIKAVYKNPQWIYLKGNHEDMLVKAIKEHLYNMSDECDRIRSRAQRLLYSNGGQRTLEEAIKGEYLHVWAKVLNDLKTCMLYTNSQGINIFLSHAGCTPKPQDLIELKMDKYDLIWDREHFEDEWEEQMHNVIVVHGHTPVQHLGYYAKNEDLKAFHYCDNHKIDIDLGCFHSGRSCLLNLDTLEEQILKN